VIGKIHLHGLEQLITIHTAQLAQVVEEIPADDDGLLFGDLLCIGGPGDQGRSSLVPAGIGLVEPCDMRPHAEPLRRA